MIGGFGNILGPSEFILGIIKIGVVSLKYLVKSIYSCSPSEIIKIIHYILSGYFSITLLIFSIYIKLTLTLPNTKIGLFLF
jgi:hypothetical protein